MALITSQFWCTLLTKKIYKTKFIICFFHQIGLSFFSIRFKFVFTKFDTWFSLILHLNLLFVYLYVCQFIIRTSQFAFSILNHWIIVRTFTLLITKSHSKQIKLISFFLLCIIACNRIWYDHRLISSILNSIEYDFIQSSQLF